MPLQSKKGARKTQSVPTTASQKSRVGGGVKKVKSRVARSADASPSANGEVADLPHFPYFPVAFGYDNATNSSKGKSAYTPAVFCTNVRREACGCCGDVRSHVLDTRRSPGLIGVVAEVSALCPWCIADGSAAKKFGGCFVASIGECDDDESAEGGSYGARYAALMERTPGFNSWTGCPWASHCSDGCAYMGELRMEEIPLLKGRASTLGRFVREHPELFASEDEEVEEAGEGDDEEAEEMEVTEEEFAKMVAEGKIADTMLDADNASDSAGDEGPSAAAPPIAIPPEEEIIATLMECYSGPGSDPAVYKFVCRHCGEIILSCDYT